MAITILATDLAELAGPIGEDTGKTGVRQAGIRSAAAAIEAATKCPAAVDAVFGVGVKAESVLGLEDVGVGQGNLVASAPKEFVAEEEGVVDGAAERLPTESGISGIKVGQEISRIKGSAPDSSGVVAAGIGAAKIDIGRFAKVAVKTEMAHDADILAAVGRKYIAGVATVDLGGSLKEPVFRS